MQPSKDLYITKANFIQFRHQNIQDFYEFHPKELGKGAYGIVYKGKEKGKNGPWRAIKRIMKKNIKNPLSLKSQISNLSEVDHPGLIKLYETFEDDKCIYLVTDLCEGGQLFEKLESIGSFTEKNARNIFLQMLDAVNYCHRSKICHRDLKPENFLFLNSSSLNIKLIDFGLSVKWKSTMQEQLVERKDTKIVGTSYYIAPEIISGKYDQRCDIWSLGVILYVLMTAIPPFDGETDKDILDAVKKQIYDLEIPQMKQVSKQCKDLIRKILQPEDKRISIQKIYEHPWIKMEVPETPLKLNFKRFHHSVKYTKLKKIAANFIASRFSEKDVEQLSKLFKQIDVNHDGVISLEELKGAFEKQKESKTYQELREIMDSMDTDKNGSINYTEFIAGYMSEQEMFKKQNIANLFQMMDKDGNGSVDREELKEMLQKNNLTTINGKQIDEIMDFCDQNHDGMIDFNQFMSALS